MNNVTQKNNRNFNRHKKGIEKETLALFCCILFCAVQFLLSFDFSVNEEQRNEQLVVLSKQSIALQGADHPDSTRATNDLKLSESHLFSPFFFKPVAINYCDKTLLMSIKGIGPSLSETILQTRKTIGYFSTPDDLLQVKGIGKTRLLQFVPQLSFAYDHE